jgi:hypothetical protein
VLAESVGVREDRREFLLSEPSFELLQRDVTGETIELGDLCRSVVDPDRLPKSFFECR